VLESISVPKILHNELARQNSFTADGKELLTTASTAVQKVYKIEIRSCESKFHNSILPRGVLMSFMQAYLTALI
jgi:hypothetical protein